MIGTLQGLHHLSEIIVPDWKACYESHWLPSITRRALMMRYYFDIRDGEALYSDEEGIELQDQTAAEIEAANSLANMARDLSPLDERHHMAIEVRTTAGPVFQAAFLFETAPHKR
jgi:hypothetical protein